MRGRPRQSCASDASLFWLRRGDGPEEEKVKRRQTVKQKRRQHGRKCRPLRRSKRGADQRYKEFKIVTYYDEPKKHRLVLGTKGNSTQAGRMMRRLAGRIDLNKATEKVRIVDGAPWIRTEVKGQNLPLDALGLDFYHLAENVHKARRAVYGETDEGGTIWAGQLERGQPADPTDVQEKLAHRQRDPDLAGIRNEDALAGLPADEQKAFTRLWADVAALLKKAEARALDSASARTQMNLGTALWKKGSDGRAYECFRKAIALDPNDIWLRYHLATVLLEKGDVDGAFAAFDVTDLPYTSETRDIRSRRWIASAALAAWFDQTARYDAVCDRALALARDTTSPQVAERVA